MDKLKANAIGKYGYDPLITWVTALEDRILQLGIMVEELEKDVEVLNAERHGAVGSQGPQEAQEETRDEGDGPVNTYDSTPTPEPEAVEYEEGF